MKRDILHVLLEEGILIPYNYELEQLYYFDVFIGPLQTCFDLRVKDHVVVIKK